MKYKYLLLLLLYLLCFIGAHTLAAQRPFTSSLSISILDEHVGLPFKSFENGFPGEIHPGLALSFESSRKRNGAYQFSRVIQLGYYYHKDNEQTAFIAFKPKLGLLIAEVIDLHLVPGVGYARSFPTRETYIAEEGGYVAQNNPGKGHFMPSLGVGVGFRLHQALGVPLTVFTRYESFLLLPALHSFTHLGVTFSFE